MKEEFLSLGYCSINQFVPKDEISLLTRLYDELLSDTESTEGLRSDLSGNGNGKNQEKIIQIMRPSVLLPELSSSKTYENARATAKNYLGEDMALDFDMMINKPPHSNAETPWHQDAAYWINLPDKRAISFWIALDETTIENGCMWFIPNRDQILLKHEQKSKGGPLSCTPIKGDRVAIPLPKGGCTLHGGHTLHYSGGNVTSGPRRGLILNFRPEAMITLEREQGFDHTGKREERGIKKK